MGLKRGNLIKWCLGHKSYEAFGDVLVGREPIYKYGVVYKIFTLDSSRYMVIGIDDGKMHVLDTKHDTYEVLSEG